jgi:hypothetical protein
MGLDASVRCNCIREGKARQHPFPEVLIDDDASPYLELWASAAQRRIHAEWVPQSCEHGGFRTQYLLGNVP